MFWEHDTHKNTVLKGSTEYHPLPKATTFSSKVSGENHCLDKSSYSAKKTEDTSIRSSPKAVNNPNIWEAEAGGSREGSRKQKEAILAAPKFI